LDLRGASDYNGNPRRDENAAGTGMCHLRSRKLTGSSSNLPSRKDFNRIAV